MYESFYKFEKPPFKLVADPSMLFASRSAQEALGRLEYVVKTGKGITVMSGEVGTGKTTLVNRFLDNVGPELQTAYIFNPTLTGLQLLKTLADELGIATANMAKIDLTRAIYETLLRNRQSGRKTVVFVDEAQILSREALEELRLISNLETWQEKLLHIVLVGQPELLQKLESWNLRQLRQRVELFIQIEPMDAHETQQYIDHRIRMANPLRRVRFTDGAAEAVHKLSAGNPRDINKLCDAALLIAFVEEADNITSKHVREGSRTIDGREGSLRGKARSSGRNLRFWAASAAVLGAIALLLLFDRSLPLRQWASQVANSVSSSAPPAVEPGPRHSTPAFVHIGSFSERPRAEAYANGVPRVDGQVIYLQEVSKPGETWHRVLVGDFTNIEDAKAFAQKAQGAGIYSYAAAVQVPKEGLVAWHRSSERAGP